MIKIVCAFRHGKGFTYRDVLHLHDNISSAIQDDFKFICHTDSTDLDEEGIITVPINRKLFGWWNKMACFRTKGTVLYIDLDTIVMSDLQNFIDILKETKEDSFWMMEAFNPKRKFSSGVLAWTGSIKWLWERFLIDLPVLKANMWDQIYIADQFDYKNKKINSISKHLNIYSYKHHCNRETGEVPKDTDILCFHGRPRPSEVKIPIWKGKQDG